MEEQNNQSTNPANLKTHLSITGTAINYLTETGKWAKFLSVIGFIFTGLIFIMAFFAGSMLSIMPGEQINPISSGMGIMVGLIYGVLGLLYFFPTLYLFKFSQKLKLAITTKNNEDLNGALGNLKSLYKFWGILTIIMVGVYVVFGLIALIGVLAHNYS
ncbi:DUF5362 family protein [Sediminicola sp. 1XM1-17]|uniref:DUF5362 family protein n=1 Tax=Sediminicola sp. 1XM1-17 TaxID=3127702 RepID=UPI0030771236